MGAVQQILMGYGATVFDPINISSMGEWFDYRETALVGGGNPISSFAGSKGLYTATQSGTARPTYVADAGDGRGAVLFDGVNDNMTFNATNGDLFGPDGNFEMWAVVKVPASATASPLFFNSGFDVGTAVSIYDNPSSTRWYFGASGQTNYGNPFETHDDTWHVMRFVSNSAGSGWYVDGVNVGVITFGTFTWNAGAVLAIIGGNGDWSGMLRHFITFKAPLDDDTAAELTTYLAAA